MFSATAQLCDSTKAMRMRICTAPAGAAEPVLSSTPTNAPGHQADRAGLIRVGQQRVGGRLLDHHEPVTV